jgi:hypothetical protein
MLYPLGSGRTRHVNFNTYAAHTETISKTLYSDAMEQEVNKLKMLKSWKVTNCITRSNLKIKLSDHCDCMHRIRVNTGEEQHWWPQEPGVRKNPTWSNSTVKNCKVRLEVDNKRRTIVSIWIPKLPSQALTPSSPSPLPPPPSLPSIAFIITATATTITITDNLSVVAATTPTIFANITTTHASSPTALTSPDPPIQRMHWLQ